MTWMMAIAIVELIAIIIAIVIIIGFLKENYESNSSYKKTSLTGRDIEYMRRRLKAVGKVAVNTHDIFDLIYVIRDIQLGVYKDEDPYIPADPYENIGEV